MSKSITLDELYNEVKRRYEESHSIDSDDRTEMQLCLFDMSGIDAQMTFQEWVDTNSESKV